jgi:hypothetical protein
MSTNYFLGIDTASTFTNAVLFDDRKQIVATIRSLTTRFDLAVGIGGALEKELLGSATHGYWRWLHPDVVGCPTAIEAGLSSTAGEGLRLAMFEAKPSLARPRPPRAAQGTAQRPSLWLAFVLDTFGVCITLLSKVSKPRVQRTPLASKENQLRWFL